MRGAPCFAPARGPSEGEFLAPQVDMLPSFASVPTLCLSYPQQSNQKWKDNRPLTAVGHPNIHKQQPSLFNSTISLHPSINGPSFPKSFRACCFSMPFSVAALILSFCSCHRALILSFAPFPARSSNLPLFWQDLTVYFFAGLLRIKERN